MTGSEPEPPVDVPDPYARTRPRYRAAIVASTAGTSMAVLATTFAVYGLSQSVLATAIVLVLANIPMVLLASVSSALLHRFGAARVYSSCDIALFLVTMGLALLSFGGHLNVPVLFAWQLACGIALGISGASYSVLPHLLAAPGKVPEYNAELSQSRAVATLIGLLAGGLVIETIGTSWVFVLDALTFLTVPLALARVRGLHQSTPALPRRLRLAFAAIRGDDGLRSAVAAGGVMALLASPIGSLFPAMASRLGASSHLLSLQMAAFAVGGLFIALVVRRVRFTSRWSIVIRVSIVVGGAGLLALAYLELVEATGLLVEAVLLLILVAVGLAIALIGSVMSSLIQMGAPDERRTTVLTVYAMVIATVAVVSGVVVGLLTDLTMVWVSLAVLGILFELFAILGSGRRVLADIDRLETVG